MVNFISHNWYWIGAGWVCLSLIGACIMGHALNNCRNLRPLRYEDYERIAKGASHG